MTSPRTRFSATLLVAVSSLLALFAVEGLLRLILHPSQLYSSAETQPERNQWRNEVQFWERYVDSEDANFSGHDPVLGWDFHNGGRRYQGGTDVSLVRTQAVTRIVAVGDSFVWGNEVAEHENFSALLAARLPSTEVLNMGVPGYGIDQAYLKYIEFGAPYRPDVVILGIYTSDYERSSMAFTTFSKPRFQSTGAAEGDIVLTNSPVPAPTLEIERISRALEGRWWMAEILSSSWQRLNSGDRQTLDYLTQTDEVVAYILASLRAALDTDQRLIILHIPRAEAFIDPEPLELQIETHLRSIYRRLEIPVIDLGVAFLTDAQPAQIYETHYVHRPDGSVGHLSTVGHTRVAQLLELWLEAR